MLDTLHQANLDSSLRPRCPKVEIVDGRLVYEFTLPPERNLANCKFDVFS